jgi:hypothetical protein
VSETRWEWDKLIRAYERGSATQVDFCASRGINIGTFQYHLYRSRDLGARSAKADETKLVRVELPSRSGAIEVTVSDVVVRVVPGTDVDYVASLVNALRSR